MQKNIYKPVTENFDTFSANYLSETIQKLLEISSKVITVALSGGNTPMPILDILKDENIDWTRVSFYMVDERCVLEEDALCNFSNISKVFFRHIPSKVYPMVKNGTSFKKVSENYHQLLDNKLIKSNSGIPEFDLILLGMGNDGHTASLFPKTEALNEQNKFVILNTVPQLDTERITLTYPVILEAKQIIVFCKGAEKERIIEEIYANKGSEYPMDKIVKEHTDIKWIIG